MKAVFYSIIITLLYSCQQISSDKAVNEKFSKASSKGELLDRSRLELLPKEYVSWVKYDNNGLSKSRNIDNIQYSVLFKPVDYITCMELRKEEISKTEYNKKKNELGDMQYFDLTIKVNGFQEEFLKYDLTSKEEYNDRVNYCAFKFQNDISLYDGKDSIPCSLFH